MSERTCVCGKAIDRPRSRYCSKSCENRDYFGRNRERLKDRHVGRDRDSERHEVACVACGTLTQRYIRRGQRPTCSYECRSFLTWGRWPASPVPNSHPSRRNETASKPGPSCRVFIPDCVVCGKAFATPYTIPTCSTVCAKAKRRAMHRSAKDRRRAVKRNAFVANVSPQQIYERDRWRCKLCDKALKRDASVPHPLAPTIDHVVPLSVGGAHEPANCQAAHFICNSRKSDRGGGEQLALIG